MTEPVAYLIEPAMFAKLRLIEKRLYGDGSILTADARRDLANLMNLTLDQLIPVAAPAARCAFCGAPSAAGRIRCLDCGQPLVFPTA